jgi:hypothetical protein
MFGGMLMNNIDFVEENKDKLVRLFMNYNEGADPDYVYILGCYEMGMDVWLKVGNWHEGIGGHFRIVKMSDVDTIEYYESDGWK